MGRQKQKLTVEYIDNSLAKEREASAKKQKLAATERGKYLLTFKLLLCIFYSTSSDVREAKRAIEDAKNARTSALPITIHNITADVLMEITDDLWSGCEVTTGGDIIVRELPYGT